MQRINFKIQVLISVVLVCSTNIYAQGLKELPRIPNSKLNDVDGSAVEVDWHDFGKHYIISKPELEFVEERNVFGNIIKVHRLKAIAEAKEVMKIPPLFDVRFYDADGVLVEKSFVFSKGLLNWNKGEKRKIEIIIDSKAGKFTKIKIYSNTNDDE